MSLSDSQEEDHMMSPRKEAVRSQLVDVANGELTASSTSRTKWALSAVAVLTMAVATGAAVLASQRPVTDTSSVACRLTDQRGSLEVGVMAGGTAGSVPIPDAIAACGTLWTQGIFTPGATTANPAPTDAEQRHLPVPALTVCVNGASGAAVVVPSADPTICAELNLSAEGP